VVRSQPPYLASADIPTWLETLKLLLSPAYRGWLVVSGRGGLVTGDAIRAQKEYLETVLNKIERLAQKKSPPEAADNLVAPILGLMKVPASRQQKYALRLRHGLRQYYVRHHHLSSSVGGEE